MAKTVHSMIRVLDEARSIAFYREAFGLEVADRPTWLDVLERGFVPTGHYGLRVVTDMRRKQVFEIAAPDARPLIWTGGDEPESEPSDEAGDGLPSTEEQVVTLGSAPRRIWIYRPQRGPASAPVLVVFDGRGFVDGGLLAAIDEFDSPPSIVIAIDHERAETEVADAGPGTAEVPDGESRVPAPNAGDARPGSPRGSAGVRPRTAPGRCSPHPRPPRSCGPPPGGPGSRPAPSARAARGSGWRRPQDTCRGGRRAS